MKLITYFPNCPNLDSLVLSYNQVPKFKLDFVNHFQKLEDLYLYNNPIQNIPNEIFNQQYSNVYQDVRNYLQDLQRTCKKIQTYFIKGKPSKVMQLLLELSKKLEDSKLRNHASLIAARFAMNERQYMKGTVTPDGYRVKQVKILGSLQYLLEEVEVIL